MIQNDRELHVLRDNKPAFAFVSTQGYKDFIAAHLKPGTLAVCVHTRSYTLGSPTNNQNNHPMYFDKTAVVHNGIIHNHNTLFDSLKYPRHAETDSDILRAIIDNEGLSKKAIRTISRCTGSVAMAALSPEEPGKLLLVRSGSPLVLAEIGDTLVFASEKQMIHKAMRPWKTKWGIVFQQQRFDISFRQMKDNTAWLFGPDGLEWHDECQTSISYVEPHRVVWNKHNRRAANDGWHNIENAQREHSRPKGESERSKCTEGNFFRLQCKCGQWLKFDLQHFKTPLNEMVCTNCNRALSEEV